MPIAVPAPCSPRTANASTTLPPTRSSARPSPARTSTRSSPPTSSARPPRTSRRLVQRTPRCSLRRTLTTATGEEHYFPKGRSVARMVHGERSVGLLYGQRALLIGALEPLTYTGTMLSTRAANKPFKRLARTAKIQETVFLGTRAEAEEVLAGVHALHETIKGELAEAAGVHPA